MTSRYEIAMHWGDMDAQGHINNVAFVDYLQEARSRFLKSGPHGHLLEEGVIVVWHRVQYLKPVKFSTTPLQIEIGVYKVGGSLFEVGYRVFHEGELAVEAASRLCPFDFDAQLPRRLTPEERAWFTSRPIEFTKIPPLPGADLNGQSHCHPFNVRWSDLDSYGHVNNIRYYEYLQEARIGFTSSLDPDMVRSGSFDAKNEYFWVLVRQDVKYVNQMNFRLDPYEVLTAPVELGNSSITLAAEIVDPQAGGQVCAQGRTVLVCVDPKTGRATPLPANARASLEQNLVGYTVS